MNIHHDIPPFRCWLLTRALHKGGLPEGEEATKRCTVFSVSSYQGHEPTFSVQVQESGAVFHNVPIRHLRSKQSIKMEDLLFESDMVFHNCPDYDITVTAFSYLLGPVHAFVHPPVATSPYQEGKYLFTIDWFKDNHKLHLIALKGGQYVLLPTSKVRFRPPGTDTVQRRRKRKKCPRFYSKEARLMAKKLNSLTTTNTPQLG